MIENRDDLIYDWNTVEPIARPPLPIELDDETLRDGLQCPSVRAPALADRVRLLHLMDALGIGYANVGLPGAGPHVVEAVRRLVEVNRDDGLALQPNCAARTVVADIAPVAEIQQATGVPIEVSTFIGSSRIRAYTEDWDLPGMLRHSVEALTFARREGLSVMFVTSPRASYFQVVLRSCSESGPSWLFVARRSHSS
jgi:2-isopropylmalate synthase